LRLPLKKASGALKIAVEMDRTRSERSERLRDYIALLTPLVTIITLALTLIAQNWQFLRSERNKREEAMDAQWQDALKIISASGALSPGVVALQPFLRSEKYGEQAREAAVNLLVNSSDPAFFTTLFGTALVPATWVNMDRIVRLDRALYARYGPIRDKTWDSKRQINDTTRLTTQELATYSYVRSVVPVIASQIGTVLRTPRPPGTQIDRSGTYWWNADWKGVDLERVSLENIELKYVSLKNAELAGVTQFSGAVVTGTAWWECKSINKPLLEFLKTNFALDTQMTYGPLDLKVKPEEYDEAVRHLESQLR